MIKILPHSLNIVTSWKSSFIFHQITCFPSRTLVLYPAMCWCKTVLRDPCYLRAANTDVLKFLKWQQMRVIPQVSWPGSSPTDIWEGCYTGAPLPRSPIHPHPPLWGVHTFPVFLECCLSAPSSAKETLTAINYHTGWTKGIPLCWNIHVRTHRCSTDRCIHPQMLRDTTWPPLVCFTFDKWA